MTKEEAISLLSQVNHILVNSNSWLENTHEPLNIAFDMAIKALEQEPCEDAVSREAVKEVLRNRIGESISDCINALPSVTPTQKWIPCSERLPEVGERVLCQCQANIYEVLKLTVDGWYHDNKHCYMSGFVIAWMPLPDLYKAESEV